MEARYQAPGLNTRRRADRAYPTPFCKPVLFHTLCFRMQKHPRVLLATTWVLFYPPQLALLQ